MSTEPVLKAIAATAHAWRDPDYAPRAEAVQATLGRDNRFTTEALAFAINQQMHEVNVSALEHWRGNRSCRASMRVGVLGAGNVPLASFQDFLAVLSTGHQFVGHESSRSPVLLEAFARDLETRGGPSATFVGRDDFFAGCEAVIGSGSTETMDEVARICDRHGIEPSHRLLRGTRFGVAILDGHENEEHRICWAEDVLLHEGLGCRNVAITFAPEDVAVDPYLEALAVFRGTFPAHPQTSGNLRMQQAFLKAVGIPHAFADGHEFLVSRGAADVQPPGHLRWTPYGDGAEVSAWLAEHAELIQVVACRSRLAGWIPERIERCALGNTQRPPLDWRPDGQDTMAFLTSLSPA